MTNSANQHVTGSAAVHAERIRAREQRAGEGAAPVGQSTAELYAARVLPGYAADEALREAARIRELQARGVVSAEASELADDIDDEVEEYEEEYEEEEPPVSTSELYAARERERQAAEHEANLKAHEGATRTAPLWVGHRYAEQLAQPHRYADRIVPKPAA